MVRLFALVSFFPISLAMVLATIAVLAVPQNAFADAECETNCNSQYPDWDSANWECRGLCCIDDCANSTDPDCGTHCCEVSCNGDPDCMATCNAAFLTCVPFDCVTLGCADPPCVTQTNNCSQITNSTSCSACKCKGNATCVCGS